MTSATSGRLSRPPSPTTSTGSPAASRAAYSAGTSERARTSTAHSPGLARPASTISRSVAATQRTSPAQVGCSATTVVPCSATSGRGRSRATRCRARSVAATVFARLSSRPPLRWLTVSSYTRAGSPSQRRKCAGNPSRFATDAPRQP